MASSPDKISFCITCKGRLHHLKETLPQNLANSADYPNVEFVILDYDSRDGLGKWIKENYQKEMDSGKIRYVKYEPAEHFKMAHAKNLAHRAATGDILCNIDADNIMALGFAGWLNKQFSENRNIFVRRTSGNIVTRRFHQIPRGLGGRIAIARDDFERLHGYNEKYEGWGFDDEDFAARAKFAGLTKADMPYRLFGSVIQHEDQERIVNTSPEKRPETARHLENYRKLAEKSKQLMTRARGFLSKLRPKHQEEVPPPAANTDGNFGCGKVCINFQDEMFFEPMKSPPRIPEPILEKTDRREVGFGSREMKKRTDPFGGIIRH